MIDLIDIEIPIPHKPFGTLRILKREGGTFGVTKRLTKSLSLYDKGDFIKATSLNNGTQIAIRCCPGKALQGHNIFGSDNVIGLSNKVIKYALVHLGIEPTHEQQEAWKVGEFELRAIDITHRFAVDSHALVSRLITHIVRTTAMKFRPTPIYPGIGVTMRDSDRKTKWLFYDKRLEFDDKRYKEAKYLYALIGDQPETQAIEQLLRQESSNNIRAELKLDKDYLKKNKLSRGSAWSRGKTKEIYFQELELLRLDAVPSIDHAKVLLDRLTEPKLRQTFIGWFHGEDLSRYGNRQTLRGRQNAILNAVGIDILNDAMPLKNPPLNMADIFDADNVLPDFPEWADRYPQVSYKGQDLPHKQ